MRWPFYVHVFGANFVLKYLPIFSLFDFKIVLVTESHICSLKKENQNIINNFTVFYFSSLFIITPIFSGLLDITFCSICHKARVFLTCLHGYAFLKDQNNNKNRENCKDNNAHSFETTVSLTSIQSIVSSNLTLAMQWLPP